MIKKQDKKIPLRFQIKSKNSLIEAVTFLIVLFAILALIPYYLGKLGKGRLNIYKAVKAVAISTETAEDAKVKYVLSAKAGDEPKIWLFDSKGSELANFYSFSKF